MIGPAQGARLDYGNHCPGRCPGLRKPLGFHPVHIRQYGLHERALKGQQVHSPGQHPGQKYKNTGDEETQGYTLCIHDQIELAKVEERIIY